MLRYLRLWLAPLIFIGLLFYLPLARIVSLGLSGPWLTSLVQPETTSAIWFTLWQAAISTIICLLIGIPGAYVLYRKSFSGQRFLRALITVPLVLPTIVTAIIFSSFRAEHAIYEQFGLGFFYENSVYWIIAAHVFVNYALIVRSVGGVWLTIDNDTEDAAALAGAGRLRTLISISLPQLKPAIASSAALTFLFCVASYGIILVLGGGSVNSIETEIAKSALQFLDLPKASALALLQTLITAAAFIIAESIARQPVSLEQVSDEAPKPRLDKRDWPAAALTAAVVLFLIALPIALVLVKSITDSGSFTMDNFLNLNGRGERALLNISVEQATLNTIRNVLISTTISVGLGSLVSFLLSRTYKRTHAKLINKFLDVLFLLPIGISSVVLGFGYLITFYGGLLPIQQSWLTIPLVQALMAMPLVTRIIYPALVSIGTEHREAASLAGANSRQTWWFIETGIIRNVIFSAIGFALIASIGEYGAASLLALGSQATLPTVLYALISRPGGQNFGMAMAVSSILIVLTFILVFATSARKKPRRHRVAL